MAIIKSFSYEEGNIRGDMFYIKHNVDCFTVIDCYLKENDVRKDSIINEIVKESNNKYIQRFISTHPDDDHIHGIEDLWKKWSTKNFYCVANNFAPDPKNPSLTKYIELRDNHNTAIHKGLKRAFLNKKGITDDGIDINSSGINFLWPDLQNEEFKTALKKVQTEPNNICPAITYKVNGGPSFLWMGDMETEMQKSFYESEKGKIGHIDIVFAPHHGRESGSIPEELMKELSPEIIVIGNAPSKNIKYLDTDLTITQNTSGDILFDIKYDRVIVYTQRKINNKPNCLKYDFNDALSNLPPITGGDTKNKMNYLGTLML